MIASVLMFSRSSGAAMPVSRSNFSMSLALRRAAQGAHVNDRASHGGRRYAGRAAEVRPAARALPALEVSVGGRDAPLARRHDVAVAGHAHRASRGPPLEARLAKDPV